MMGIVYLKYYYFLVRNILFLDGQSDRELYAGVGSGTRGLREGVQGHPQGKARLLCGQSDPILKT